MKILPRSVLHTVVSTTSPGRSGFSNCFGQGGGRDAAAVDLTHNEVDLGDGDSVSDDMDKPEWSQHLQNAVVVRQLRQPLRVRPD